MKRLVPYIIIVLALGVFVIVRYGQFFQYVPQIVNNLPEKNTPENFHEQLSLTLPKEFSIEVFAKDLPGARVIVHDVVGNFWVSQPSQGKITALVDNDNDGKSDEAKIVLSGLNRPHGLTFKDNYLYVAETSGVNRYQYSNLSATKKDKEKQSIEKELSLADKLKDRERIKALLRKLQDIVYQKE